jgi:hypothetical protein
MIIPTVGRVVWFWPEGKTSDDQQPCPAIIAYVWSDRLINIAFFDMNGEPDNETSVPLIQEGEPYPPTRYCEWMPYQKKVAAGEIEPTLHAQPK